MSSKRTTYAWLGNKKVHGAWWYDGEIDLGFSGALRSAATVVSDGPLFGLIAYGGDLKRSGGSVEVVPKDGLRTRFYIVRSAMRDARTDDARPRRFRERPGCELRRFSETDRLPSGKPRRRSA